MNATAHVDSDRPRRHDRIIAGALGLVVTAAAILAMVLLAQRQRQAAYAMPVAVLAVAALCLLFTLAGAILAMGRVQPLRRWFTLLTTLLFVTALITMFSFGVLFLVVAVVSLVVRPHALPAERSRVGRPRLGAGLLLSLGFPVLCLLAIQGPIVACTRGGVSNSAPLWTWFSGGGSGSSGSASGSSASNEVNGTVTIGATTYSYTCAGDRLVRFSS